MFDLFFPKHWSTLKKLIWLKVAALSSAVQKTVSGAILSIKDALAMPAQSLVVDIDPVQSGSGDPAPDNVRAISGWTGCNIYHTGKNLFPATLPADRIVGQILSNGTITSATNARVFAIPCKQNTYFYFSQETTGNGLTVAFGDKLPVVGDSVAYQGNMTNRTGWKLNSGSHTYLLLAIANENQWQYFATNKLQIEIGESKTDYEAPKNLTTYSITFPDAAGTVYGGTLDVTNGVLTVTHASVDLGSITWYVDGAKVGKFRSAFVNAMPILTGKWPAYTNNFICSTYKSAGVQSYTYQVNGTIYYSNGSVASPGTTFIRIVDNAFANMSKEDFTTAVTGQTLVYELYEPQTYQLTPQEVTMLLGNNTLWADTGDTTLTYMADGTADDVQALNILLGGRYVNNHGADEATDAEALEILLGGNR